MSINTTGKPDNVIRKMVSGESVRGFAGEVMDQITAALDRVKVKPGEKPASKPSATKAKASTKKTASRPATKRAATKKAAKKGKR